MLTGADLRRYLEATGLDYQIDHRLVRGLDYYTRTVFEIAPPEEGRMVTIVGGGRYDGLIEQLGGRSTPGIGYGMGLERVIQNVKNQNVKPGGNSRTRVMVAHLGDAAKTAGVRIASDLRSRRHCRHTRATKRPASPAPLRVQFRRDPRPHHRRRRTSQRRRGPARSIK